MSRTTTHDISGEILLGIFRAVYGDLQVFRNTSTITTGPGGPGGPGGPSYYDYDDDDEDGEDDDYMSREEYRMLNMAIANSIETMPEFDFTSRNEKIVLNVSSRTVAEEEVNTLCCGVCLENYVSGSTVAELPCQHLFHSECILSWAVQVPKCPVCRQDIPSN